MVVCFVGLKGNLLSLDIFNIYNQVNGIQLFLRYMLDYLLGNWVLDFLVNFYVVLDILFYFYKFFLLWNFFFL